MFYLGWSHLIIPHCEEAAKIDNRKIRSIPKLTFRLGRHELPGIKYHPVSNQVKEIVSFEDRKAIWKIACSVKDSKGKLMNEDKILEKEEKAARKEKNDDKE